MPHKALKLFVILDSSGAPVMDADCPLYFDNKMLAKVHKRTFDRPDDFTIGYGPDHHKGKK